MPALSTTFSRLHSVALVAVVAAVVVAAHSVSVEPGPEARPEVTHLRE